MADEIKNMGEYTELSYIEFLESLARCADVKHLFTKEELEQHGMKHSLEAMEKTEFNAFSKKPKVWLSLPSQGVRVGVRQTWVRVSVRVRVRVRIVVDQALWSYPHAVVSEWGCRKAAAGGWPG